MSVLGSVAGGGRGKEVATDGGGVLPLRHEVTWRSRNRSDETVRLVLSYVHADDGTTCGVHNCTIGIYMHIYIYIYIYM